MVKVGESRILQKLRISPTDDPGYEKYKVVNTTQLGAEPSYYWTAGLNKQLPTGLGLVNLKWSQYNRTQKVKGSDYV